MSRSRRIPIIKQKPRNYKRTTTYWRPIRSRINQIVRGYSNRFEDLYGYEMDWDEELQFYVLDDVKEMANYDKNHDMLGTDIPNPKTIINDWRYCDYVWDYRSPESWNSKYMQSRLEYKIKCSRK